MKIEITPELAAMIKTALDCTIGAYSEEASRSNTDSLYQYWDGKLIEIEAARTVWEKKISEAVN